MDHSIGSSGKTYEKTPRQRNPQKGLVQGSNDDKRNHYSHLFSYCGVAKKGLVIEFLLPPNPTSLLTTNYILRDIDYFSFESHADILPPRGAFS